MKDSRLPILRLLFVPVLLPVLTLGLSACGSGNDGPKAMMGQSGTYQKPTDAELKRIPLNAAALDGAFSVPSDLDITELTGESKLPFVRAEASEASSPSSTDRSYITFTDSEMNPGSNLVFRAIRQVPPRESILKVKKFQLKLEGLNVYKPAVFTGEILDGQVLCFLDGKACVGSTAQPGAEKGEFLKRASSLPGEWLSAADFKTGKELEGGAKVLSASGEVVVDFLKILKGDDAALVDFIYRHSEDYSEQESGYRKFRFAVGDRVFLSSGSLDLEFETDPAKMPAEFSNRPPLPKKGASDQVYNRDQVKSESQGEALPGADLKAPES